MEKTRASEGSAERIDIVALGRLLLPKTVYALGGFFAGIASLPFGAFPFGIALLSAADTRALYVYAGLVAACLFAFEGGTGAVFFGIYTATLLLRILVRLTVDYPFYGENRKKPSASELIRVLFAERTAYKVICSTLGALAVGLCFALRGGFLYYDVFGMLLMLALVPLSTYVFSAFFSREGIFGDVSLLCIFAACMLGASDLKLYGVSIAVLGGLFITFTVTDKKGIGYGAVCGLVLGAIYSPILSPVFVVSALCIGVFKKISVALGCFCAFFCAAAWGFYVKGIYALDGLFAAILSACLIYSVAHRLFSKGISEKKSAVSRVTLLKESELDGIRLYDINRKMSAISDGLSSMCSFFEEIKLRYPKQAELMQICKDALDSSCAGCPMREGCRERGRIENAAGRLSFLLKKNRGLTSADFESELVARCSRLPDILDEINYNSGLRIGNSSSFEGRDEVSAPDYRALSKLLEKSMECDSAEYRIDRELSEKLCRALEPLGIGGLGAMVWGNRKRTVCIRANNIELIEDSKEELLKALENLFPFSLDEKSVSVRRCSGEGGILTVCEADRLHVEYTFRQSRACDELRFCGDSVSMFKNRDNRFFSLISDGMGSGREAAAVSEICVRFMESMLAEGAMNDEHISMLGGMLAGRCEGSLCECSTTVDLMELDLISGKATFFKSGAAPTYVWHNGNLFKLRSRTLPIGILFESESKKLELTLSEGDVVVMVSDGVTGGEEECPWLFELLRQNVASGEIERTADLIVKYAVGHGSADDITVAITKISA